MPSVAEQVIQSLQNLPKPANRNLSAEMRQNFEAINGVRQDWVDNATQAGVDYAKKQNVMFDIANPELSALLKKQDAGVDLGRIDPAALLAQLGGGGGGGYQAITAPTAYVPDSVAARAVGTLKDSELLKKLNADAMGQTQQSIISDLEGIAREKLALGGNLTPQEQALATEAVRTGMQARGLYDTNAAIAGEVLNLDALRRQRESENIATAQSVAAQVLQNQELMQQFGLSVEDLNRSMQSLNTTRAISDADRQLTAGQGNQMSRLQAGLQHNADLMDVMKSNQAAAGSAASRAMAADNAAWSRYMQAMGYNADAALSEFGALNTAVDDRMALATDPLGMFMDVLNPQNPYAQGLNEQNFEGAWSGYNADSNAIAAGYGAEAQMSAAKKAANAKKSSGIIAAVGSVAGSLLGGLFV